MKTIEKQTEHHWKPMEEYKIEYEGLMDWIEGNVNDRIEIIRHMQPNQYINICSKGSIKKFNSIIEYFRENGLDIGKGNCEYGYKMPLPKEKNSTDRELIIFRRAV